MHFSPGRCRAVVTTIGSVASRVLTNACRSLTMKLSAVRYALRASLRSCLTAGASCSSFCSTAVHFKLHSRDLRRPDAGQDSDRNHGPSWCGDCSCIVTGAHVNIACLYSVCVMVQSSKCLASALTLVACATRNHLSQDRLALSRNVQPG